MGDQFLPKKFVGLKDDFITKRFLSTCGACSKTVLNLNEEKPILVH